MKTSFVSTSALSQSMRYQMLRMQQELAQKQQESISGKVADAGVALGADVARTVSLDRDIQRLGGLIDSNALASNRLSSTQDALSRMAEVGQSLLSTLTTATSGSATASVLKTEARNAVDSLTNLLNTNLNGEYLFAGINTDVKPISDFTDPSSASKAAFDQAFFDYFGFAKSDPDAGTITGAEMQDFLETAVEPQFLGAGWQANWSSATDQRISSRISLNDTTQTSVTANTDGSRKLMMAAATISSLMDSSLNEEALGALYGKALSLAGEGIAGIGQSQAEAGVAEKRISDASERISAQIDLSKTFLNGLEGIDPYEAATKVSDLLTQIETSYALTGRIQQLSLVNYLP